MYVFVCHLTLLCPVRSAQTVQRWRFGVYSSSISCVWWECEAAEASDLQNSNNVNTTSTQHRWCKCHCDFLSPPSSNSHQTSIVPLLCFVLNWLLASTRRWFILARSDAWGTSRDAEKQKKFVWNGKMFSRNQSSERDLSGHWDHSVTLLDILFSDITQALL